MMIRFNASENPRPYTGDNHVLPRYRSKCNTCRQVPDIVPVGDDWAAGGNFWDDAAYWDDGGYWND